MTTRPLPRSLDPLPDESLPGYVLRLAHRLEVSPTRLAILTGINSPRQKSVAASRILSIEADMAATFATATRLTVEEVNALTMSSLSRNYPPLAVRFRGRHRQVHGLFIKESWVFARATRYCPDCLAGDGSTIQQRHGGGWSKLWRLPVVFACPVHQRLLRYTCPGCGDPAHYRRSGSPQLLPLAAHPVTHPAACRNPLSAAAPYRPCGQRLDQPVEPAQSPPRWHGREPLRLQQHILDLLHNGDQGEHETIAQPTTAARYFIDLRILSCLLQATWPVGRHLVTEPAHADVLDNYVEDIRRQIISTRATGRRVVEILAYDKPPLDPETCAILLTTAQDILTAGDAATVRRTLRPLINMAPFAGRWIRRFVTGDGYCSPRLQAALGPATGTRLMPERSEMAPRLLRPLPRPVRFGPQHIPQYLPSEWYHEYFAAFGDVPERFLRRAVTVLLARTCLGGNVQRAGSHLGMPPRTARYAVNTITTRLRRDGQLTAFQTAVDSLAEALHNSTNLTDFGRRRQALNDWSITDQQWTALIDGLVGRPVNGKASLHTDWSDRKRLLASVWIWTRVTQSEPYSAPLLRPDPNQDRPGGAMPTYVLARWGFISAGYGHYADLRRRLDSHATGVAQQIDKGAFPLE